MNTRCGSLYTHFKICFLICRHFLHDTQSKGVEGFFMDRLCVLIPELFMVFEKFI
jgi:hypothetical protein